MGAMLTDAEIDALEGKRLDSAIMEYVFGYTNDGAHWYKDGKQTYPVQMPFGFTDNLNYTWQIVDKLETLHLSHAGEHGDWIAGFCSFPGSDAHGETAPLAICRAALKAVK